MTILNEYKNKIVLFDGVCNFCNYWVNFILDRDPKNQFKFAALQSKKGTELLEQFNLPKDDFDSFILISDNKVFKKSIAAFEIAKQISGWPKIILPFRILPTLLTDFVYDIIAKNRYKLFGKKEACRIPTPEEKSRFL
jgi:predicted DCC family thiol-disulfide oxidoreductase YuxK